MSSSPCVICGVPAVAKGLCGMHYRRHERGQPVDDGAWAVHRKDKQRAAWVLQHERDVIQAYAEHGKTRPCGPVLEMEPEDWAAIRPDSVARFTCLECHGVWHVRRHYDDHECESRVPN